MQRAFDFDAGAAGARSLPAHAAPICDGWIIFLTGALMTLGAVMVFSASVTLEGAPLDLRRWWTTPLRQCVFAGVGLLAALLAARIDYRVLAWPKAGVNLLVIALYGLAALTLVAVLIPGIGSGGFGAQRSIFVLRGSLPLSFQPSELAKVVLVLWLASWLARSSVDPRSLRGSFVPAVLGAGVLIGLTGIEDFGTAALMGAVTFALLFAAGADWRHLAGLVVLGAAAGAGLVWLKPYRIQRILAFFSDEIDAQGAGYQITQSLVAIASGGWWGRGLGAGVQKYGYLPQDNNDFIFAILCEELGVFGGLFVILAFLLILLRGGWLAARAADPLARLLATGITSMICLQAAFNIAVVTHAVPTKGISLPFVSAGGSGVLFLGIAAGVLASTGRSLAGIPRPTEPRP